MATVALEGISKYFGTVPAVQDLSCTIAQGEFLALLGPSGCGKTTTLLMLAGIYRPASGTLRFNGRIVNDLPPRQRNIGMVFQSYALYPHLSVYENLAFPLRVQRQSRLSSSTRSNIVRRSCNCRTCCSANRHSFRVDSSSVWRWDGRSLKNQICCCLMNP